MVYAEPAKLIYGDGQEALLVYHNANEIDAEGTPMVRVAIVPTRGLIRSAGIQDEEYNEYGHIIKTYPKEYFLTLNEDSVYGAKLLLCDYHTRPTPMTNLAENYLERIKHLQRLIVTLKAQSTKVLREHQMLQTDTEKYERATVDRFVRLAKIRGRDTEDSKYRDFQPPMDTRGGM